MLPKQKQTNDLGRSRPGGYVRFGPKADIAARHEILAVAAHQPLSTAHFETRVYFMNLYIGMVFEGLSEAFVNVRAALRPSDFLVLHFRFARDRRLFKGNLVGLGQFCCVRRHRHKRTGDDSDE